MADGLRRMFTLLGWTFTILARPEVRRGYPRVRYALQPCLTCDFIDHAHADCECHCH